MKYVLLFCALERSGKLDWLENRSSDWRALATLNPAKASRDIVIIDIDNPSFREITAALDQRWNSLLLSFNTMFVMIAFVSPVVPRSKYSFS